MNMSDKMFGKFFIAIKYNPKKIQTIKMILKGWKDGVSGNSADCKAMILDTEEAGS